MVNVIDINSLYRFEDDFHLAKPVENLILADSVKLEKNSLKIKLRMPKFPL